MTDTRTESDSFGPIDVPAHSYWGAQTERSIGNFPFGAREQMPIEVVRALGFVKQAAARVNARLGNLDPGIAEAIQQAAGLFDLAQDPPDHGPQRLLHDLVVGNQAFRGFVVHRLSW